jgi:rhodanese-related sulfurtransferase
MPQRLAGRVGIILLVSLVAGTAANLVSPSRIKWIHDWSTYVADEAEEKGIRVVDIDQVRAIVEAGSHFIFDARPASDYAAGNITGAFSLPVENIDVEFEQYAPVLTPDQAILVYCSGKECDESLLLGTRFIEHGFTNVVLFAGGYSEWSEAEAGASP